MSSKSNNKKVIFALGSNLGDRAKNLDDALLMLKQELLLENVKTSKILINQALLLPDSPPEWNLEFFNIAISGVVDLSRFEPLKILEVIKQIEQNLQRNSKGKWSPRTIDIDILLIENTKIYNPPQLVIPHIEILNRDFFLIPLNEIEPDWQKIL